MPHIALDFVPVGHPGVQWQGLVLGGQPGQCIAPAYLSELGAQEWF